MKKCYRCLKLKPDSYFRIRKDFSGKKVYTYRQGLCNQCEYSARAAKLAVWKKANKSMVKLSNDRFRSDYSKYTLHALKQRAKRLGVPFNLTQEDIVIPDKCPVLGLILQRHKGSAKDDSPSIDRIIPSLGYTKGNVCVISRRANWLKNNASLEELEAVTSYTKRMIKNSKTINSRGGG